MEIVTYLTSPKIKNIIIFTLVSILALQTLYFIHVSGVNILHLDDWRVVPLAQSMKNGDPFWQIEEFVLYNDQRAIFPNLILLVNVVLTSWNVMYTLYFGWFLLALSIVPTYLILKKTDYRLIWIIIPIVAFLFNPAQYVTLLMDVASRWLLLTSLGIIFSVYFINRVQFQKSALLPAILFAIIASFSSILGLAVWIVGVLSLTNFDKTKKTPLIIWVSSAFVVFLMYSTNYTYGHEANPINPFGFFTLDFLQKILLYLSNGLIPHATSLLVIQMIAGFVIISLIIGGPIYLRLRQKEIKAIVPWIQFGLIGLIGALATVATRIGFENFPFPHYITIAVFSQISALVIATVIFVQIHNGSSDIRKKTVASMIFLIFIVITVFPLSASYIWGWNAGFNWHEARYADLECLTNPIFDFNCSKFAYHKDMLQKNGKILKEVHLGPFANQNESLTYLQDPLLREENWEKMEENLEGSGAIEYVDSKPIGSDGKIQVSKIKTLIDMAGWGVVSSDKISIESKIRELLDLPEGYLRVVGAYVFIDNKIHTKVHYGLVRPDISEIYVKVSSNSGWNGIIDLRELSPECHDVSVRLVNGNQYFEITSEYQICIN